MEVFIWNLMSSGATNVLKSIIGQSFTKLEEYFTNNNQNKFNEILSVIIESNDEINKKLESLKKGDNINQNHSGNGNNIVGGQTINNIYNISSINTIESDINLSVEAEELLSEAIKDEDGAIFKHNFMDKGYSVSTNHKEFIEENNPRSSAKYISALDELEKYSFVETENNKRYRVTNNGYKNITK